MVYLPQVFQFTPLREGRPAGIFDATRRPYFNSRPSARGDCPCSSHTAHSVRYFNSRPSARGDRQHEAKYAYRRYFNSRPSARGDRLCTSHKRQLFYFNSRPSARGDDTPAPRPGSRAISIHAPPRGATRRNRERHPGQPISIHAPPRGATSVLPAGLGFLPFQFTPLREGRRAA